MSNPNNNIKMVARACQHTGYEPKRQRFFNIACRCGNQREIVTVQTSIDARHWTPLALPMLLKQAG